MLNKNRQSFFSSTLSSAIFLVLFSPFGIDLVLPATNSITRYTHAGSGSSGYIVSVFVFALGIGQIPFGRLSDYAGRRLTSISGLIIFATGSCIPLFTHDYSAVLVARFVQGLGASATTVCAFAIVRDNANSIDAADGFAKLTAALNLATTIAPLFSLVPLLLFGWQSIFVVYIGMALAAIYFVIFYVRETAPPRPKRLSFLEFSRAVSSASVFLPSLVTISMISFLFCHVATAPIILMDHLGLTSFQFGVFFTLNALVIVLASLSVTRITSVFGSQLVISAGVLLIAIAAAALWTIAMCGVMTNAWSYILPVSVGSVGFSLGFGNAQARALSQLDGYIGFASGLLGTLQMCTASAISALIVKLGATGTVFGGIFFILFAVILFAMLSKQVVLADQLH